MFAFFLNRSIRHRRLICAVLLTGLLAAGAGVLPASAQQPAPIEADTTAREASTRPVASAERKSPVRAVFYSAAGTAVLTPVGGVGVVVGPALGHFYANNHERAWWGITLRTVSLGSAGLGGILALGKPRFGWTILTAGLLVTGGSALYDIVTAWNAAKDYNESHGMSAQVTPTVGPRGEQVGLALRVSF